MQQVTPHSVSAEQSVLSCCLIDSKAALDIVAALKAEDFYTQAHTVLFAAILTVAKKHKPVDFVTVTDELERTNSLDEIGGIDYLTTIVNFVPSASNFSYYVEIVKQNAVLRSYIKASADIITKMQNGPDFAEAVEFAEKRIFEISQQRQGGALTHAKATLFDVLQSFEDIQKNKGLRGIPTGFYGLDQITHGLQSGDLILIAARPGFGKTSLAMNIVTNAVRSNYKAAVFSLEMPKTQLMQRIMCSVALVDLGKALSGKMDAQEWQLLESAVGVLEKTNLFIDDSSLNTPMEILSKCRRLKAEQGLDLVMIDYLQLMQTGGKAKENRQQEITEISRSLKILAKELDVPVIVLSQLSRAVEGRKDHRPVLSDLRESGAIEQDADIVLFINRTDMYGGGTKADVTTAELIIAKHRQGALGEVFVKWVPKFTTFMNSETDANAASLEKVGKK